MATRKQFTLGYNLWLSCRERLYKEVGGTKVRMALRSTPGVGSSFNDENRMCLCYSRVTFRATRPQQLLIQR